MVTKQKSTVDERKVHTTSVSFSSFSFFCLTFVIYDLTVNDVSKYY